MGTDAALREPADGYTGVVVSGTYITSTLVTKPNFDAIGGVQPIIEFSRIPGVLVVGATSNAKTLADFIAMAKKAPGHVTYGSSGTGSLGNLAGEFFVARCPAALRSALCSPRRGNAGTVPASHEPGYGALETDHQGSEHQGPANPTSTLRGLHGRVGETRQLFANVVARRTGVIKRESPGPRDASVASPAGAEWARLAARLSGLACAMLRQAVQAG